VTAPGLDFRDMTEADLEQGLALSRSSGWNQTLADWRLLLSLGPGLFRVASKHGKLVASGGAVSYGGALAWICMILVAPEERGRGLGKRVFDEVLGRVRALVDAGRLQCVGLDATPAGRGLYLRKGFVDGPRVLRLRAEPDARPRAAAVAGPIAASELARVLERDRVVFGADRSGVLRALAEAAPELARGAHAHGELRGYCLGRGGDLADQVGPVVADDLETARSLVASVLTSSRKRPLVIDARADPRWLAALGGLGFREQRPLTRMYLGGERPHARPELEPAILGPEFG
jgi:GNAT superfamily N-acetyltransferase